MNVSASSEKYVNASINAAQSRLTNLVSALEAFYQRVELSPNALCFVQPGAEGEVRKYSWADVDHEVRRMEAYLRRLNLPAGSTIGLFSKNCAQWIMSDLAIWMAGHVTVPIYPTLTCQSIKQIVEHSEIAAIFVGAVDNWPEAKEAFPATMPGIAFSKSPSQDNPDYARWDDILHNQQPCTDYFKPDLDTLATIVYTSGTTGMPKGVMHSFRTMGSTAVLCGEIYESGDNDRILSYLPLAHAAERAGVEICQLYIGFTIYFCHSLATFPADLKRAAPTLFFAVPRVWMKLQQGVLAKISHRVLKFLLNTPVLCNLVRSYLLKQLGLQHVRIGLSGGAPLSTSLLSWYKDIGLEILEGYAMTENFAYSHTSRVGEVKIGYVGMANPLVECRIDDNGEILIRSPTTMLGYYKSADSTKEVLEDDGFFHTGDMGEIDSKGRLRITGRLKELFKSSKGKYVSPAPIENHLLVNRHIEQVCVTGASLPSPLALLNLSESAKEKLTEESGCREINAELTSLLEETNARLDKHEQLQCLIVVPEIWNIENNFATPTLKIRRNNIDNYYSEKFEEWHSQGDSVILL